MTHVRDQRKQSEKGRERVFAFRGPCDRLHVQRMQREQRRHDRTRPDTASPARTAGCATQKPKNQHDIRTMEQRIHEQMPARVQAEQLTVDHVRDPGQRMPVRGVKTGERLRDTGQGQAAIYHRVFGDVIGIIEIDKLMTDHLPVNRQRRDAEPDDDEKIGIRRGDRSHFWWRRLRHVRASLAHSHW